MNGAFALFCMAAGGWNEVIRIAFPVFVISSVCPVFVEKIFMNNKI